MHSSVQICVYGGFSNEAHWFPFVCLVSTSVSLENGRAEEDTRSCRSDSAASGSLRRPLQAGGWTPPPENESKKTGGAEQRNEWRLQRRTKKKTRGCSGEEREDRMRGQGGEEERRGQWRGEGGRRRERGRARGGTPAGRWSGCDSAGRWEGGMMWTGHAPPAEVSPALQPTSESWTSERGLPSSVAGASDSELQEMEEEQLGWVDFILKTRNTGSSDSQTERNSSWKVHEAARLQEETDFCFFALSDDQLDFLWCCGLNSVFLSFPW